MSTLAPTAFYNIALGPVIRGLKNAHAFISKAYAQAESQNIEPSTLTTASLAPDMFDFVKQIQRFTDSAKFIAPRVNPEIEGISLPDTETTFPELLARIDRTVKYLESVDPAKMEGREGVEVVLKFKQNTLEARFTALEYVTTYAHPNFWFHVVTAYDILRHKGIDIGKFDFTNGAGLKAMTPVQK